MRILVIIGGGIAAYKCLDLIRRLRERGDTVRVIMTKAAQEFVTPLSIGALSNEPVLTDLFDLDAEREIGHIKLARWPDCILVAPATADLMARMALGLANDLATTVLLATDKPIVVAPAMNPVMWAHPATQRNAGQLVADGCHIVGPAHGEMAERGEAGAGRLVEVMALIAAVDRAATPDQALRGVHVLVTAGPTHEAIDPVRYIANRSSGKQGYAIAAAAARHGARVTLVSGPTTLAAPHGVDRITIESAQDMLAAVEASLPADCAIFTAAVADWRVAQSSQEKIKKDAKAKAPKLELIENPDILKTVASLQPDARPALVIGFAAETETVLAHATAKRQRKGCDWIVANDVSPETGIMGGDRNTVHLITATGHEAWVDMPKTAVAEALIMRIIAHRAPQRTIIV